MALVLPEGKGDPLREESGSEGPQCKASSSPPVATPLTRIVFRLVQIITWRQKDIKVNKQANENTIQAINCRVLHCANQKCVMLPGYHVICTH